MYVFAISCVYARLVSLVKYDVWGLNNTVIRTEPTDMIWLSWLNLMQSQPHFSEELKKKKNWFNVTWNLQCVFFRFRIQICFYFDWQTRLKPQTSLVFKILLAGKKRWSHAKVNLTNSTDFSFSANNNYITRTSLYICVRMCVRVFVRFCVRVHGSIKHIYTIFFLITCKKHEAKRWNFITIIIINANFDITLVV